MTIAQRRMTLVWIDADGASIVRWPESTEVERLESEVPPHRRSTGHVRHEPTAGHGGIAPQDAGERHRNEHLRRFISTVAESVEKDDGIRYAISVLQLSAGMEDHLRLAVRHAGSGGAPAVPVSVARLRRVAAVNHPPANRGRGAQRRRLLKIKLCRCLLHPLANAVCDLGMLA